MNQWRLSAPILEHAITTLESMNLQFQRSRMACALSCSEKMTGVWKLPRHCIKLPAATIACANMMKVSVIWLRTALDCDSLSPNRSILCKTTSSALEKFYEVRKIRESLFGMESSPVIQTMLRIGNIQLSKGEVKKALDCFSEVSGVLEKWLAAPLLSDHEPSQ